jgi:AAA family ATP:ADP antiporter
MRALVDIRSGERGATLSAFFTLFGITAAHTLLETARDALFLARIPVSRLPFVSIALAAIGLLLLTKKSKAREATNRHVVAQALVVAALVTGAFWGLSSWKHPALLYALYLWSGLFASWVVLRFWLVLGGTFNVTQAKRLYGFIGAGSVLGAVFGAGTARVLAAMVPARHLLLGSSTLLLLTAAPSMLLASQQTNASAPTEARPRAAEAAPEIASLRDDLRLVRDSPFITRILWLVLLSTVTVTFVDYIFKSAVTRFVAPDQLGAYFASVAVVTNAIALVAQLFAVGWILRTFGVHRALWVMPVLLFCGSVGVIIGGGLAAALLLKGVDGSLRYSVHRTSTELLYLPISDRARSRIKPFIDLVGQRGGQAAASIAILAFVGLGFGHRSLALVAAVLALGWVLVAADIKRHYLELFRATLRDGRVDYHGELPTLDLGALEALFAALSSSRDVEVLAALDLLEAQDRQRLVPPLILYHPSRDVVLKALDLFVRQKRTDFVAIADRLDGHADVQIRAAALRARSVVVPDEVLLRAHLDDPSPEVRTTAYVSLVWRGWLSPEEREAIALVQENLTPAAKIALVRAIREEPSPVFHESLMRHAESGDTELESEVALAMGRIGSPEFFPVLFRMLEHRYQGSAAREAFVAAGARGLEFLDERLGDTTLKSIDRASIPRALGLFEPWRAVPLLMKHLVSEKDGTVRFRILRALSKLRAADPAIAIDRKVLVGMTEATLKNSFRLIEWGLAINRFVLKTPSRNTPALQLISTLLRDKESHALGRIFLLLGLIHPGENFERIYRGLQNKSAKARASSRELIENLIRAPLRSPLLALVDDLPAAARLEAAAPFYTPAKWEYETLVHALVSQADENLHSLAKYHAIEAGLGIAHQPAALGSSTFSVAVTACTRDKAEGVPSRKPIRLVPA